MYPFSQGFLSDAVEDVRTEVLARYAPWRQLLLRANAHAVDLQHLADINSMQPRDLLAAAHFARLLASVQASVIVLERGMISQSKALLRMALESLFALEALHLKPEIAADLARTHEVDKRVVADRMLRWKSPELRAAVSASISDDELKSLSSSKAREVKTFELARDADMTDWYLSLYAVLSFPVHGAVSDLTAHLETDSDGNIVALKNEPEVDGQEPPWAYASEIIIKATESFASVFSLAAVSTGELRRELQSLTAAAEA